MKRKVFAFSLLALSVNAFANTVGQTTAPVIANTQAVPMAASSQVKNPQVIQPSMDNPTMSTTPMGTMPNGFPESQPNQNLNSNQGARQPQQQPTMPSLTGSNNTMSQAANLNDQQRAALAEESLNNLSKDKRSEVFNESLDSLFPFTPNQIRQLNGAMEQQVKARYESTNPPAEPIRGEVEMSFDDKQPPIIMVDPNNNTTLRLVDKNNFEWNYLSAKAGNGSFSVSQPIQGVRTNLISLGALVPSGITNLTVYVDDNGTPRPLYFTLVAGQPYVHYEFLAKIQQNGPNTPVGEVMVDTGSERTFKTSEDLEQFRTGVTPKGLRELKVRTTAPEAVEAWLSRDGKSIFVRTKLQPHAPYPYNRVRLQSGDYIFVYDKQYTISMLSSNRDYDITFSGIN